MKKTNKSLVIVESPAKIRTLSKILKGKYEIKASYGHIRDLPKSSFGINIEKDFKPTYKIIPGRARKIVKELKEAIKRADKVILATDPDREGEAIAWHIIEGLGIPPERVERISFNEITPPAVLSAFKHPRQISMSLVNAQQTRRFMDRIVGYKLSPLLWKKIARGLSAGRVQSVAVKFLVDREKAIAEFKPQEYWKISGDFQSAKHPGRDNSIPDGTSIVEVSSRGKEKSCEGHSEQPPFNALLYKLNEYRSGSPADKSVDISIPAEADARKLVAALELLEFSISKITEREIYQSPPPPFITSTLQQQASTQLGFSTKKTMMFAQQLYEGVEITGEPTGLITYMRTDAVRVSEIAISDGRNFITKEYGADFLHKTVRRYKSRKGAQAAHEAIRPTYVEKIPSEIKDNLTPDQYKLYDLIWRRFVATQMKPAHWKNKSIEIEVVLDKSLELEVTRISKDGQPIPEKVSIDKCIFKTDEKKLFFKGFLLLYPIEEMLLPLLEENNKIHLVKLSSTQNFTQPPPRYTEASLVKTLEKYGIGRPSTYAPIISTIQQRGYVRRDRRQLAATELGILVTEKLVPYFKDILNTKFTSQMEKRLDEIEADKIDWITALKSFYHLFHRDLERASAEMVTEKGKESANAEKCDKCGKSMVERWGRYGKFIACSGYPECKNIISLKPSVEVKETCEKCGKPMVIKMNKRGRRFLACSGYPDCKNTKSLKEPDKNGSQSDK